MFDTYRACPSVLLPVGWRCTRTQPAGPGFWISLRQGPRKRTKESCNAVKTILPSRTCNNRMQAATRVIAALRPLQALATKGKLLLLQALAHRFNRFHARGAPSAAQQVGGDQPLQALQARRRCDPCIHRAVQREGAAAMRRILLLAALVAAHGGGRPQYAQPLGSDQREAAPPRTSCKSWRGGSPASAN